MRQQIDAWAPGRVNLIGEHTDHTDGLALPMALDVGVRITGTGGPGEGERAGAAGGAGGAAVDRIVLRSDADEVVVDVPADGSLVPPDGWGRYVAAVAHELAALGRPPVGLQGEVRSTLPQGIGLSSSAALEVAVAVALLQAAGWPVDALELVRACRRAEHRAVGVPSGVLDQAASVLCEAGSAVLLDCADLSTRAVPLPAGVAVVVVDSGVRRTLEGSGYAERTRELAAGLPVLGDRRPADVPVAELAGLLAGRDDVPARRVRHVVTENDRVRRTVEAFAAGDLATVGDLLTASHVSLREDFAVTVPETDRLVELLLDAGAVAARMTGGGFGGAVIGLVEEDGAGHGGAAGRGGRAEAVGRSAAAAYRAAFPEHEPQVLVSRPGAGAAAAAPGLVLRP